MGYVSFQQMPLWNLAVDFAAEVYKFSDQGHLRHDFRLRDQVRSAAVSISSNIAEGFEFRNNKDFIRFLYYSKGSASEVFTHFAVMHRASLITDDDFKHFSALIIELSNRIGGLIKYLKTHDSPISR